MTIKLITLITLFISLTSAQLYQPFYSTNLINVSHSTISADAQYIAISAHSMNDYDLIFKQNQNGNYSQLKKISLNSNFYVKKVSLSGNGSILGVIYYYDKVNIFLQNNQSTYDDTPHQSISYSFPQDIDISDDGQLLCVVGYYYISIYRINSTKHYNTIFDENITSSFNLTQNSYIQHYLTVCDISKDKQTVAVGGYGNYTIILKYDSNINNYALQQIITLTTGYSKQDLSLSSNGNTLVIGRQNTQMVYQRTSSTQQYQLLITLDDCDSYSFYSVSTTNYAKFIIASCSYSFIYVYTLFNNTYKKIQSINSNISSNSTSNYRAWVSLSDSAILLITQYSSNNATVYKLNCLNGQYLTNETCQNINSANNNTTTVIIVSVIASVLGTIFNIQQLLQLLLSLFLYKSIQKQPLTKPITTSIIFKCENH